MIYKYKTERRSPKDFGNYQNPIDLFINVRDRNVNPREVSKNQIDFKLDLGEIEKRKFKIKIRRSNKSNKKCSNFFFDWREKSINFYRNYFLSCLKLNTKHKMEKVSKKRSKKVYNNIMNSLNL